MAVDRDRVAVRIDDRDADLGKVAVTRLGLLVRRVEERMANAGMLDDDDSLRRRAGSNRHHLLEERCAAHRVVGVDAQRTARTPDPTEWLSGDMRIDAGNGTTQLRHVPEGETIQMVRTMPHIALLGDSIFDNAAYTGREPDVISHLRATLPSGWSASLHAVDGSVIADLPPQVERMPPETSHVVVSIGGNDALMSIDLLDLPVRSTAEALALVAQRSVAFERAYRSALDRVIDAGRPVTLCTIYNGNLPPEQAERARVALMVFNDVIVRVAVERALDLIDLRIVCSSPDDYANPIEPSGAGGLKIARAIARATGAIGSEREPGRMFAS